MHPLRTNEGARRCDDVVRCARSLIGAAASPTRLVVICFLEAGIALPDGILELHLLGERITGSELLAADLIFRTGLVDAYHPGDHRYGVGHVGICTGERTVVHASPFAGTVREDGIDPFLDDHHGRYRGTRRLIARA